MQQEIKLQKSRYHRSTFNFSTPSSLIHHQPFVTNRNNRASNDIESLDLPQNILNLLRFFRFYYTTQKKKTCLNNDMLSTRCKSIRSNLPQSVATHPICNLLVYSANRHAIRTRGGGFPSRKLFEARFTDHRFSL